MRGFTTLEKKYGVTVVSEGYWFNDYYGKMVETFNIYAADGCPWAKGLKRKDVKTECEKWAEALLSIKANERR